MRKNFERSVKCVVNVHHGIITELCALLVYTLTRLLESTMDATAMCCPGILYIFYHTSYPFKCDLFLNDINLFSFMAYG